MRLGDGSFLGTMRGRQASRKVSAVLIILVLVSIFLFCSLYSLETIVPTISRVAENEAKVIASVTANNAITEVFGKINFTYDDLISFTRNEEGKVTSLNSNMINVNKIKSAVALLVQEKISSIEKSDLSIPLGTLLGSDAFAGLGPRIDIELMPVGVALVDIISEFTDSGINQTRLVISLVVNTDIMLLMPGFRRVSKISCDVPVIDTVIVGDIPSSYVNVDREGYEFEDDVLQLAEE